KNASGMMCALTRVLVFVQSLHVPCVVIARVAHASSEGYPAPRPLLPGITPPYVNFAVSCADDAARCFRLVRLTFSPPVRIDVFRAGIALSVVSGRGDLLPS